MPCAANSLAASTSPTRVFSPVDAAAGGGFLGGDADDEGGEKAGVTGLMREAIDFLGRLSTKRARRVRQAQVLSRGSLELAYVCLVR